MKTISIAREPERRWWTVRARCLCGCGVVVRAAAGATLEAAIWRFRGRRHEEQIIEAALGGS